jgi:hypothetical protein
MAMTYFTDKTWNEFLNGGRILRNKQRTKLPPGTCLLCSVPAGVVGIIELTVFPGTNSVCRESSLLDPDVYSGADAKYNKWEYGTKVLKTFDHPIPYSELAELCGIDNTHNNNIAKRNRLTYCNLFYKGPGEDVVLRRVQTWIRHMLA